MYAIIIGGGRTGSHLAALLFDQGHEVRIVENRLHALENLHRELPTELIYEGDGTDPEVLDTLEAQRANVLVAVTSDDADNLVAASLAREHYGVGRIIARAVPARVGLPRAGRERGPRRAEATRGRGAG